MDKLRIWVDFDPEVVDVSGLKAHFGSDPRFEYIAKRIESHEEAMKMAETCDFVINTHDYLGLDEFKRLEGKVKMVIRYGTGYDKIDVKAATACGIPFANTPGANAAPVAELALMHMIICSRNFMKSNRGIKPGAFPNFSGREIDGKTVGLVGFGNVARNLVRMLKGFDVKIVAYDAFINDRIKDYAKENNVTLVDSIEDIFKLSDIISLHIPATKETEKSINKRLFDMAHDGIILINTCRGKIVDETDLAAALKSGKVAAAGLDVLYDEPPKEDCPLLGLDNVSLSGHIGGSTYEAEMRTQKLIADTVEGFLKGEFTFNVINKNEIRR